MVCRESTCDSTEGSGSMEIPRVIVGDGSVRDVACDLPFKANIAEGLELERLDWVRRGDGVGRGYPPRSWNGFPGH